MRQWQQIRPRCVERAGSGRRPHQSPLSLLSRSSSQLAAHASTGVLSRSGTFEEVTMFRTSRTARRGRAALTWLGEWRLPRRERGAARSARGVERKIRLERLRRYRAEQEAAELTRPG